MAKNTGKNELLDFIWLPFLDSNKLSINSSRFLLTTPYTARERGGGGVTHLSKSTQPHQLTQRTLHWPGLRLCDSSLFPLSSRSSFPSQIALTSPNLLSVPPLPLVVRSDQRTTLHFCVFHFPSYSLFVLSNPLFTCHPLSPFIVEYCPR